ncbi:MAG: hypothetical protein OXI91_02560 [Chloroflexota bacterium]|nr:hypothetical protein [Chloroflexota bacterium]
MLGALPVHAEPAAIATLGPLIGLAALGAFHGMNPAMGWLFAVSLGLQRESVRAIGSAVLYISLGHVASLLVVAVVLALAGYFVPLFWVRIAVGVFLAGFGIYKLALYYRHFRWVGMNVSGRDLIAWSFLMATSHGAGLMLAPVILNLEEEGAGAPDLDHHSGLLDLSDTAAAWGVGLTVHTLAMLAVMLIIALIVYRKLGLAFLRRGWLNVDLLWSAALILAGLATLTLAFL